MAQDTTGVLEEQSVIRTPDQRLRVFVSSTLGELAPEREAVKDAVERLRLAPVMFEFGARPHPPRTLYRAYLEQSHIFLGIYWQSYGWVAPDMEVSGIEDEYRLAGSKPSLIYIKKPAPDRQPQLAEMLKRIQTDDQVSYKSFETPEDLGELVASDLLLMLTERFEEAARPAGTRVGQLVARPLPVPPTPLIGREDEVSTLVAALSDGDARLMTLTGLGGVGKSRLALEVATRSRVAYPDGVFYVELASVTDEGRVPATIASALGVYQESSAAISDSIAERLGGKRALLVLDNFEQVAGAAPFLADLLAACPTVDALVTSRSRLHLRVEREHPVSPLPTPARTEGARPTDVETSPAVRLFVERGREAKPGCELTEQNAGDIAEICRRLDGVPLALELAAARLRVLSPSALLSRIGKSLDLFSGPADLPERQRTLRATIDWSYRLLEEEERALFARLGVFVGGFTLESAQAVAGDGDILETLSSLVDKSLVAVHDRPEGEPRFRLLEMVREYALERLAERGETDAAFDRFANYFAALQTTAGAELQTRRNRVWLARMDDEWDNIRSALAWDSEHGQFDRAYVAGSDAWEYWWVRGYAWDLVAVDEALWSENVPMSKSARMRLAWGVQAARQFAGDPASAVPVTREMLAIARELVDEHWTAIALGALGIVLPLDDPEARSSLEESVAMFRKARNPWGIAAMGTHLGDLVLHNRDVETAIGMHREALACARDVDSDHFVAQSLHCLGRDYLTIGDVEKARACFVEGAEIFGHLYNREGVAYCLEGLAGVAVTQGCAEAAATAMGAAGSIREQIMNAPWHAIQSFTDGITAAIRALLGFEAFEVASRRGAEMRPDEALAFALEAVRQAA